MSPDHGAPGRSRRLHPEAIADYVIVRPLDAGGMGVIFEARHRHTGAPAAIKTVQPGVAGAESAIRREIGALRGIDHPGVIKVLDEGAWEGMPWYAMELIEGPSLVDALATRAYDGLTLLRRVCSALAFLHGRGIVHRDLSPRNILLRDRLSPVLVDFGFAARHAGATGRETVDAAGTAMGTAAYMAPEQIRGELVDARADLYSVGCILYEQLTGRAPFSGGGATDTLRRHLHEPAPRPSDSAGGVPPELDALVLGLLAKSPRDRIGYAQDVGAVLSKLGAADWPDQPASAPAYVYRPAIVGRHETSRRLDGLMASCMRGEGQMILVAGESGSGKTRLVAELATRARKHGVSAIVAECATLAAATEGYQAVGRDTALHPLRPLLHELSERCRAGGRERTERLLGARGKVLAPFLSGDQTAVPAESGDPRCPVRP